MNILNELASQTLTTSNEFGTFIKLPIQTALIAALISFMYAMRTSGSNYKQEICWSEAKDKKWAFILGALMWIGFFTINYSSHSALELIIGSIISIIIPVFLVPKLRYYFDIKQSRTLSSGRIERGSPGSNFLRRQFLKKNETQKTDSQTPTEITN